MEHGEGCGPSPLRSVSRDDIRRSRRSANHMAIVTTTAETSWEIFLTMEPPLRNSCQRLRALEPTTIWVI